MRTKKLTFILCLLLVLLSMASVSASDFDDMAIQTSDDTLDDVISSDEVNIRDMADSNNDAVESNEANAQEIVDSSNRNNELGVPFNILQSYIDESSEGSVIGLDQDFSLANGESPISISKSITIDGKNHTLDGANQKGIISIDADGKNVVLRNIIFVNGKSDNGGAILNTHSSSSLTFIDCEFRDNYADENGGAIYCDGKLDIINSKFQSNKGITSGGAIYCKGETNIRSSEFINNQVNRSFSLKECLGGAICSEGNLLIENVIFSGNKAIASGGAIYCKGETNIRSSEFKDNIANWTAGSGALGGAIRAIGKCYIDSCKFNHNIACYDFSAGGAIYSDDDLIVTGQNIFKNNIVDLAAKGGGAIYACKNLYINWGDDINSSCVMDSNSVTLPDSNVGSYQYLGGAIFCGGTLYGKNIKFNNNDAMHGGAIYCKGETHINNSEFLNNNVSGPHEDWNMHMQEGGAISSEGKCYIYSCIFEANTAGMKGGAIYADNDLIITGQNRFTNNHGGAYFSFVTTMFQGENGGAIHGNANVFIENANFTGNYALDGGAIYSKGETSISNSRFEDNAAKCDDGDENSYGGAIYSKGLVTVNYCIFNNNIAESYGGAIYTDGEIRINNCSFVANHAEIYAGAVYTSTIIQPVSNSSFINNKANKTDGGAIYINNKCSPEFLSCRFEENFCPRYGGAIYIDSSSAPLNLVDCTFVKNSAYIGGAVYVDNNIGITSCSFVGNHAAMYAGAVYTSTITQTVSNSVFNQNKATSTDGGAIYINNNCNPEFTSCSFEGNTANNGRGGAIYMDSVYSYLGLYESTFSGNFAKEGGAVYAHQLTKYLSHCVFSNNHATNGKGGALYVKNNHPTDYSIYCEFMYSTFEGNTCTDQGGAVYFGSEYSHLKITSCSFTGNSGNRGGAVYCHKVSYISSSNFINNNANGGDGGAIYINNDCNAEITSCRFEGNYAYMKGGAICMASSGSVLGLYDSTFSGNSAQEGGAVYANQLSDYLSGCVFRNNNARSNDGNGGALYVQSGGCEFMYSIFEGNTCLQRGGAVYFNSPHLKITNCTFIGNDGNKGGAVFAQNISYVTSSVFLNNSAHGGDGGAIYINEKSDAVLTSCRFERNTAYNRGGAVYLQSTSSNLSVSYCTFVDNMANKTDYSGSSYCSPGHCVFNSGNYIFIDMCWFGLNDPKFNGQFAQYGGQGKNDIDYTPTNILSIFIKLNKENLFLGNPYIVTVYFKSNKGKYLSQDLLHSSGRIYGDGQISNPQTDINDMTADIVFDIKNPTIYGTLDHQTVSLTVQVNEKIHRPVTILSCENISYPDALNVTYGFGGSDGNLTYEIKNSQGEIVRQGKCNPQHSLEKTLIIDNLYPGDYTITISNPESDYCYPSNASANFKVFKAQNNVRIFTCPNITYPNPLSVTFHITYFSNETIYIIRNAEGRIVKQEKCPESQGLYVKYLEVDGVYPGDYSITIHSPETELYLSGNATANFKVAGGHVNANLTADNVTYGTPTTIVLEADCDGLYNVDVNGLLLEMEVINGFCIAQVKLNAGEYHTHTTNEYVTLNCRETSFTVDKAFNNVVLSVENVTYGSKSPINIMASADGDYIVNINGTVYVVSVMGGIGNKFIGLNAGDYYANVTFDNENYNSNIQNTVFTVYKADIDLVVVVFDDVYLDEVECIVYASADGDYELVISNGSGVVNSTVVTVKDNFAYFIAGILDVGTYEAVVSFAGDGNYNSALNQTAFTVYQYGTSFELEINASDITYGETATVTPVLTPGATGNISYYLSNGTFLGVLKYNENLTLPVLDAGTYMILANYSGDNDFEPANDSIKITVRPAPNNVEVTVSDLTYGEDALIVISADIDGVYKLDINGTIYRVTVKDGAGNKSIGLNAGDYYANVTFDDKNYNTTSKNAVFTVNRADIDLVVVVFDEVFLQDVEGVVYASLDGDYDLVISNGSGEINSTLVSVRDNLAYFNMGILDAGTYEASISFAGNGNYNPALNKTTFIVHPAGVNFEVEINASEITYGGTAIITHVLSDGATGTIKYYLSNGTFIGESPVSENLFVPVLDVGTYMVIANYSGDNNFISAVESVTFTVIPAANSAMVTVSDVTYGEGALIVVYADVDGTYQVDINGTLYDVAVENGAGNRSVSLNAGKYYANVSFDNGNYNTSCKNDTFTVHKADIDLVVVVFNEIYEMDVEGIVYATADLIYDLVISNGSGIVNSTAVTVKDSLAYFNMGILPAGTYEALVSFAGNGNYNPASNKTGFTVYQYGTMFEIEVNPNEITYGETATVTHVLSDGATGTISYYLSNGTLLGELPVSEDFTLPVLDAGYYMIIANYSGDNNFISAEDLVPITVIPAANSAMVSVSDLTYGEDALILVSADVDGIYQVDINGTVYNVTVKDGAGNISIPLNAGDYYANVSFDNRNYNTSCENDTFTVYKADTNLDILAFGTVYLQDLEGFIYSDVDGEYTVTAGEHSTTVFVKNGFAIFNLGILNAGNYLVTVTFPGDLNHKSNSSSVEAIVSKLIPRLNLDLSEIDYGEVEHMIITSNAPGSVNVTVNGITKTIELNGKTSKLLFATLLSVMESGYNSTLNLYNLGAGTYPVTVTYNGDENIMSVTVSGEFKVNAANPSMDIKSNDISIGDDEKITVKLPSDATGNVTVTIDGKDYTAQVKNGKATITIPNLSAGTKNAEIHYSGDGNYNPASGTVSFEVNKLKANMSVESNEPESGEDAHIVVNLPKDATGTVTLSIDGKDYTAQVKNGKAIFDIPGLAAGKHDFTAYYSGDDKYDSAQIDSSITVKDKTGKDGNQTYIISPSSGMAVKVGNPIMALLLSLMTIGFTTIRKSKKY